MRVLRNLLHSTTQTATNSDNAIGRAPRDITEARGTIELYVIVTAASGTTPTLIVQANDAIYIQETMVQASATNGWQRRTSIIIAPPTITATGLTLIGSITDYGTGLDFSWTIGGTTPSFTFEIWAVYEAAD